ARRCGDLPPPAGWRAPPSARTIVPPATLLTVQVIFRAIPTALLAAAALITPASAQSPPRLPEPEIRYPFVCTTARNGLGQPIVDNQSGHGIPVAREDSAGRYPMDDRGYPTDEADIVGWSRDCEAKTRVDYLYRTRDGWEWVES